TGNSPRDLTPVSEFGGDFLQPSKSCALVSASQETPSSVAPKPSRQEAFVKRLFLLAFALLIVAAPATAASPAKQPVATGFYQGQEVSYFDFGPIKLKPGNKLAPIWTVTNGAAGQHNIINTVPGKPDYSPLWQL